MSITDLIMVFEVHIKMQVHSISYQTKLKPMCLVYTANYKHAYCMYKTYNYIIHMYVCFTTKKLVLTKISLSQWLFIGNVVSLKFLSWPERGKGGGHRLSRFKKSAGDRAVNDGKTSLLIQSWPTLCEKKIKIFTSEMLQWCDSEILLYSSHLFLKTQKREHILKR